MNRGFSSVSRLIGLLVCVLLACVLAAAPPAGAAASTAVVPPALANGSLVVFAASSMTNALEELGERFTRSGGAAVKLSFAASSALARQIEGGAPADIFLSADVDWMDYLQAHGLIRDETRRDVVGNRLVLIAPSGSRVQLSIAPGFALSAALAGGRLATGDPDSVPVGRYARTALTRLGVWESVADHLVRAENVRAALAFVERGEAPLGIVYRTDALIDPGVRIVGEFPSDSHPPIVYPLALTQNAKPGADRFAVYLSSPEAAAVFVKYGFTPLH